MSCEMCGCKWDGNCPKPESVVGAPQVESGSEIGQRMVEWEIRAANRILSPTVTGCERDQTVAYFAMIIRDEFAKQRPEPSSPSAAQEAVSDILFFGEKLRLNLSDAFTWHPEQFKRELLEQLFAEWNAAAAKLRAALAPPQPTDPNPGQIATLLKHYGWEERFGKWGCDAVEQICEALKEAEATHPQPSAEERYDPQQWRMRYNTLVGQLQDALGRQLPIIDAIHELKRRASSPQPEELARRIAAQVIGFTRAHAEAGQRGMFRQTWPEAQKRIEAIVLASLSANLGQKVSRD